GEIRLQFSKPTRLGIRGVNSYDIFRRCDRLDDSSGDLARIEAFDSNTASERCDNAKRVRQLEHCDSKAPNGGAVQDASRSLRA
ncbi:MAG: hypothetical protein ACXWJB_10995, partial [Limisphaerales bacterium]